VGPRAGLDGYGKSPPTGNRSPDRTARSELLYRLRYPGQQSRYINCSKFLHHVQRTWQSFVHKRAFPWNVSVIFVMELSAHPVYFTSHHSGQDARYAQDFNVPTNKQTYFTNVNQRIREQLKLIFSADNWTPMPRAPLMSSYTVYRAAEFSYVICRV